MLTTINISVAFDAETELDVIARFIRNNNVAGPSWRICIDGSSITFENTVTFQTQINPQEEPHA